MFLTIGKPTELSPDDLPVRGQCQAYTKGWNLRIVFNDGREETLFTDTYHACRQIQMACMGKDTVEEMREVVADLKEQLAGDLQETAVYEEAEKTHSVSPPVPDDPPNATAPSPSSASPEREETAHLPREEIESLLRKRRRDFEF